MFVSSGVGFGKVAGNGFAEFKFFCPAIGREVGSSISLQEAKREVWSPCPRPAPATFLSLRHLTPPPPLHTYIMQNPSTPMTNLITKNSMINIFHFLLSFLSLFFFLLYFLKKSSMLPAKLGSISLIYRL